VGGQKGEGKPKGKAKGRRPKGESKRGSPKNGIFLKKAYLINLGLGSKVVLPVLGDEVVVVVMGDGVQKSLTLRKFSESS
jgi:hypothetical protein